MTTPLRLGAWLSLLCHTAGELRYGNAPELVSWLAGLEKFSHGETPSRPVRLIYGLDDRIKKR
jgi:hypothetical protein